MALPASSGALYCELAIAHATPGQPVASPQAGGAPLWEFAPSPAGGGAHLADRAAGPSAARTIGWAISTSNEAAYELELSECAVSGAGHPAGAVRVTFRSALFPAAAVGIPAAADAGSEHCAVYALTADGTVHRISVRGGPQGSAPGLGVSAAYISAFSVAEYAEQLGTPTAIAAAGDTLCIAGSSGGFLCIPEGAFEAGVPRVPRL